MFFCIDMTMVVLFNFSLLIIIHDCRVGGPRGIFALESRLLEKIGYVRFRSSSYGGENSHRPRPERRVRGSAVHTHADKFSNTEVLPGGNGVIVTSKVVR